MTQPTTEPTHGVRGALPVHHRRPRAPRPSRRALMGLLLGLLVASLAGCSAMGWFAHGLAGGGRRVKVEADYTGLAHQRVAVLVDVDEYTLHQHRQAPLLIGREVSAEIAEHVESTTLASPRDLVDFQRANPYWSTGRYSEVLEKLDADRLVIVDLLDYRLHEPGNMHVHQGLLSATIMVVEADSRDPDQASYSTSVHVEYPEGTKIGDVRQDTEAIRNALISKFGQAVGRLFYDHEVRQ